MLRKEASEFDQHSNFRRLAEFRAADLHALCRAGDDSVINLQQEDVEEVYEDEPISTSRG
jgi:hypothetical protein